MKKGLALALLIILSACKIDDDKVIVTRQEEPVSGTGGADFYDIRPEPDRWDALEGSRWSYEEARDEELSRWDFDDAIADQFAPLEDAYWESQAFED